MKFGCYCKTEQIEDAIKAGCDFVELSAQELMQFNKNQLKDLHTLLVDNKIFCAAIGDYSTGRPAITGPNFDINEATQYAQLVCSIANELEARCICIGAAAARMMPIKYSYCTANKQAESFFRSTAEVAMQHGRVLVLLEALCTSSCNFCNTQQQALDIVRQVDMPNFMLVVDFFHMDIMAEPFVRFFDINKHTGHVHLCGKDENLRRRYFDIKDEMLCSRLVNVMTESGYQGTVSIEVPLELFDPGALATSIRMLRIAACQATNEQDKRSGFLRDS